MKDNYIRIIVWILSLINFIVISCWFWLTINKEGRTILNLKKKDKSIKDDNGRYVYF